VETLIQIAETMVRTMGTIVLRVLVLYVFMALATLSVMVYAGRQLCAFARAKPIR